MSALRHHQLALPAVDANELEVLFGAAVRIFTPIALLHDGLHCTFITWTDCKDKRTQVVKIHGNHAG